MCKFGDGYRTTHWRAVIGCEWMISWLVRRRLSDCNKSSSEIAVALSDVSSMIDDWEPCLPATWFLDNAADSIRDRRCTFNQLWLVVFTIVRALKSWYFKSHSLTRLISINPQISDRASWTVFIHPIDLPWSHCQLCYPLRPTSTGCSARGVHWATRLMYAHFNMTIW
jgi:hypothetical protein